MAITDITFLLVIGIGILAFTTMFFIWKGILWLAWIAAIFWLLMGLWCRQTLDVTFMFQRELGVLFIAAAIAMFLAPFWTRAKQMDVEENPPDDIDIFGDQYKQHREQIDRHKRLRKGRRLENE